MCTVLGLNNVRLANYCGNDRLEARKHIGLGHPAYVAKFTVCSRTLVIGIDGCKRAEVGLSVGIEDIKQTVCTILSVSTLEKHMLNIYGVGNHG